MSFLGRMILGVRLFFTRAHQLCLLLKNFWKQSPKIENDLGSFGGRRSL